MWFRRRDIRCAALAVATAICCNAVLMENGCCGENQVHAEMITGTKSGSVEFMLEYNAGDLNAHDLIECTVTFKEQGVILVDGDGFTGIYFDTDGKLFLAKNALTLNVINNNTENKFLIRIMNNSMNPTYKSAIELADLMTERNEENQFPHTCTIDFSANRDKMIAFTTHASSRATSIGANPVVFPHEGHNIANSITIIPGESNRFSLQSIVIDEGVTYNAFASVIGFNGYFDGWNDPLSIGYFANNWHMGNFNDSNKFVAISKATTSEVSCASTFGISGCKSETIDSEYNNCGSGWNFSGFGADNLFAAQADGGLKQGEGYFQPAVALFLEQDASLVGHQILASVGK
ncbi:MAG: hypothetical protein LBI69_03930 [Puniceicoccales bacterium]|jgi:hypothetical protein|nr:hypothetical protein [Puniceicoccales bacterium]